MRAMILATKNEACDKIIREVAEMLADALNKLSAHEKVARLVPQRVSEESPRKRTAREFTLANKMRIW